VALIDTTESPTIERPKKSKVTTLVEKRSGAFEVTAT